MFQMFPTRYFEKQFELAEAVKLPMFLHMRAAAGDFCDILAQNKERLLQLQIGSLVSRPCSCRVFFPNDLDTAADALLESGHNVQ
ncbi:hypothetical protein B296_00030830 [Ensete ventricosum]|uniref:TatD related DNase n=1 Tax=Ensete ventricosum TaxID=4639 RepID=A0A426ZII4_ENSVE|nr:hypothetical protein B296_00030830 [Ensete ventricosum]